MPGVFFTMKVTPIIGVFSSANFPQEKLFSPKQSIFPQEISLRWYKVLLPDLVNRPTLSPKDRLQILAKMHVTNVLIV